MEILYSLSYDRKPSLDEPLTRIIQILWDNEASKIHKYTASTLEFVIDGADENEINKKASNIAKKLEAIAYIRLSKVSGAIMGDGNKKLNIGLGDFIEQQLLAGLLIQL